MKYLVKNKSNYDTLMKYLEANDYVWANGKNMTDWDNPWEPPMIIIVEVHHGYVHQLEYKKIHKYDEVWTGEINEKSLSSK